MGRTAIETVKYEQPPPIRMLSPKILTVLCLHLSIVKHAGECFSISFDRLDANLLSGAYAAHGDILK